MKLQTEDHSYARALRVIGQDLAKLAPHALELKVVENDFIVRGQARAAQTSRAENGNPGLWRMLQDRIAHQAPHQPAPPFVPFERKYTPDDVNRLDEEGRAHRKGPAKPPDITGLAERLRTVGRIVDAKSGRLATLIDDMDGVTVEYCDEQGKFHSEKYSMFALYKIQESFYGERGTPEPVDPWRGFDR